MSNGGSGQHPPAPASRVIHPWCETRGHGAHSFAPGDRGFESRSLQRRVTCEPDFHSLAARCALRVSDAARAGAGQLAAPPPAAIRGERPRRAPA
jgi:hypothetical protein